jgi:hypothetical protein
MFTEGIIEIYPEQTSWLGDNLLSSPNAYTSRCSWFGGVAAHHRTNCNDVF